MVVGLIMLSCNSEKQQEVETITMEDLMGEVEETAEESVGKEIEDTLPKWSSHLEELVYALSPQYDTASNTEKHIFDRFGFNTSSKLKFISKNEVPYGKSTMVTPKAEMFVYHFSDSIKLNNAFYNWLDCFGSDCQAVRLNEDLDAIKTPPSFTLVYDTTLVTVEYPCEHEKNDWGAFKDSIIKMYGRDYRYRIDVSCGGPLRWK